MKFTHRFVLLLIGAVLGVLPASAQIPDTLLYPIPAPFGVAEKDSLLGYCVAMDGDYIVASAPNDYVAKVFDAHTGAPLLELARRELVGGNYYGNVVAISGTLVAVGMKNETTAGFPGAGRVFVFDLSSATPQNPVFTLDNPTPTEGDNFGSAVAISGTCLIVGAEGDDTAAHNAGNVYVYDLAGTTPTVPLGTLSNPNAGPRGFGDGFGAILAISGTRVVAKDFDTVYAYDLSNGVTAPPVATLSGNGPVAISGTIVAVGDFFNAAVCQVFDLSSATPAVPVALLNNPRGASSFSFGISVAVSGTRVAVGDYLYQGSAHFGCAYVFDLSSATPTVPVATLDNPTPAQDDCFGWAVAISGARVVVGAPQDDTANTNAGSAYLYDLDGATPPVPTATLLYPSPEVFDHFGYPVAMSGTLMVVGVPDDGFGADSSGSAYVYDLAGANPAVPVVTLHNPGLQPYTYFGSSVAISGTRVVISAPNDSTEASVTGRAYLYDVGGPTPTVPVATLRSPNPVQGEYFGQTVAISGARVVVSDGVQELSPPNVRGVYVFDAGSATPAVPVLKLTSPAPTQGDGFGYAMGISGATLIVCAPYDDTGATDAGRAYIFDLASPTPTVPTLTLDNPAPALNDYFGTAVAIDGTHVVIGAPYDDAGATDAGSAYVYDLAGATPAVPAVTLPNPSPGADDGFGFCVAISGPRVVVGAPFDSLDAPRAGNAFVYDLAGASPSVPVATLHNPTPAQDDIFGVVAIDGVTVVVGAPGDDAITWNKGYAYVFGPNPRDQDSDGLLDAWEIAHFGTTAGHTAADDDEQDGVSNLLEEAFGTDPTQSNHPATPAVAVEGDYLTITISKQPGVLYEVQSAADPAPAAFFTATTTVLANNATTLKVRDNFPIGSTPGRFLRVKVTAAP